MWLLEITYNHGNQSVDYCTHVRGQAIFTLLVSAFLDDINSILFFIITGRVKFKTTMAMMITMTMTTMMTMKI